MVTEHIKLKKKGIPDAIIYDDRKKRPELIVEWEPKGHNTFGYHQALLNAALCIDSDISGSYLLVLSASGRNVKLGVIGRWKDQSNKQDFQAIQLREWDILLDFAEILHIIWYFTGPDASGSLLLDLENTKAKPSKEDKPSKNPTSGEPRKQDPSNDKGRASGKGPTDQLNR